MSVKAKGINAERELVHLFWKNGWACVRVAGSGSIKYPTPDLLAGNNTRRIVIECKICGQKRQYFDKKQIEELKQFGVLFGAETWVALRFTKGKWNFLNLEDLGIAKTSYYADDSLCDTKALSFNQLIS